MGRTAKMSAEASIQRAQVQCSTVEKRIITWQLCRCKRACLDMPGLARLAGLIKPFN